MKYSKKVIALLLSLLMLLQSCAVYGGDHSLKKAVDEGKKVKVKTQYTAFLLYKGQRYAYQRINDQHAWTITADEHSSKIPDSTNIIHNIILLDGQYYGFNDFELRSSWVPIQPSEVVEISKTKREHFKKIVYQYNHYWGVLDDEEHMNLVPIYDNQVNKISFYDPAMSVLASIIVTPLVIGIMLLTPVEDDW